MTMWCSCRTERSFIGALHDVCATSYRKRSVVTAILTMCVTTNVESELFLNPLSPIV